MRTRLHLTLLALFVLTAPLAGCFYSREIAHTRRDIERATGVDFDRGLMVSLGPVSLRTLGWISGLVPEQEARMARDYLREITRVKVGVYHTDLGFARDGADLGSLPRFEDQGWEVAVRFRDEETLGWVLYREHRDTVRDVYVVMVTDEELVLARVQGHLNRLLSRVMEDHSVMTGWVHNER
jgi:hypothetical protein